MKKCTRCDEEKDENEFYKSSKRRKDGSQSIRSICKSCTNKQSLEWQNKNPYKAKKSSREFYHRNSDKIKHVRKAVRENLSPEKIEQLNQKSKEYREANRESLRVKAREKYNPKVQSEKWREYYDKNREKELLRKRIYYKSLSEKGKKGVCEHAKSWRENNPNKCKAHREVAKGLKNGIIIKPVKCDLCFCIKKLDAHHDDYTKPLEVMWLCRSCHGSVHRKLRLSNER